MTRIFVLILTLFLSSTFSVAQKQPKPWTEWTKDDVEKMLDKSAWGHVVTGTDTTTMTVRMGEPSGNDQTTWNYRIRFFSARPIREAFARKVLLDNPKLQPSQLERFVNSDYSDSIVIAVSFDSTDRRYLSQIEEGFNSATTEILRKGGQSYIELKDGRYVNLIQYEPPSKDGTGAKFVFPRELDGKPLAADEKDVLRFVAIMGNGISVSYKFKVADMMYNGKLEY
jgi:hypothetical protein